MKRLIVNTVTEDITLHGKSYWPRGGGPRITPKYTRTVTEVEVIGEFNLEDGTPGFTEVSTDYRNPDRTPRCYVSDMGMMEETILDNLMNRRDRPHMFWTRTVMPAARPVVEASLRRITRTAPLGIDPDWKFQWSQYAGCSCPCSPGYIMRGVSALSVWPRHNAKNQEHVYTTDTVGVRVDVTIGMTYAQYLKYIDTKRVARAAKEGSK